jgi:murein DD-endopeptidase MepM/ murein hydrolase activator NlpD
MKTFFTFLVLASLSLLTSSYKEVKKPSAIAKELYFPVAGNQSNVGSVWGDEREGGRRKHEGIDIFAAKGTPVVAISDGVIEYAGNDDIGGKTVTLQPDDYEWEAYYAHLDVQYVSNGQRVKKGQLLGTVGNTGNARTTPAHLHFGIYTDNGAVDPLPYVKTSPKITSPVPADNKKETPSKSRSKKPSSTNSTGTVNKQIEKEVKSAAVKIVTGELLRRIKIRL